MLILGISAFYHDSAACLIRDGEIIAAAQEERFSRVKHDQGLPVQAMRYCLAEVEGFDGKIDAVAFYDKPILKFHRLVETYFSVTPKGFRSFKQSLPSQINEKLWIEPRIVDALESLGVEEVGAFYYPEHHESHAASAFYPSPFQEAAVLTIDGVGEWACATIGAGRGEQLELLQQLDFPHSLGLLYSAFTYYTGFKVNSGEYKLMGLAPYGEGVYTDRILKEMMDLREDGSFRLDLSYFGFLDDLVMTSPKFDTLLGGPPRLPETPLTRRELDVAKSIQEVTEEVVLRMARHARETTGLRNLCMAGGVALNCVANGRLLREGIFDDIWVQPAAGDAGGAVGAALAVWHGELGNVRHADGRRDAMQGSLLGPEFSDSQIREYLDAKGYAYQELGADEWAPRIAQLVAAGHVVGLFHGRMEFGPRALGHRSIIGDARSPKMQSVLNLKIKQRESFRPFAPSVLAERVGDYFDLDRASPYMLIVAPVVEARCVAAEGDERDLEIHEWVNRVRSDIPAVTHVDYSARIQTVSRETQPRYHDLINAFDELTGCGVIINTSFNVRGEPIVCTPSDAYRCFMRTGMDYLVLGSFLLDKNAQSAWMESDNWKVTFQLD
jgi:carbamoyltransferase